VNIPQLHSGSKARRLEQKGLAIGFSQLRRCRVLPRLEYCFDVGFSPAVEQMECCTNDLASMLRRSTRGYQSECPVLSTRYIELTCTRTQFPSSNHTMFLFLHRRCFYGFQISWQSGALKNQVALARCSYRFFCKNSLTACRTGHSGGLPRLLGGQDDTSSHEPQGAAQRIRSR
jgi:hypothetical protein